MTTKQDSLFRPTYHFALDDILIGAKGTLEPLGKLDSLLGLHLTKSSSDESSVRLDMDEYTHTTITSTITRGRSSDARTPSQSLWTHRCFLGSATHIISSGGTTRQRLGQTIRRGNAVQVYSSRTLQQAAIHPCVSPMATTSRRNSGRCAPAG